MLRGEVAWVAIIATRSVEYGHVVEPKSMGSQRRWTFVWPSRPCKACRCFS